MKCFTLVPLLVLPLLASVLPSKNLIDLTGPTDIPGMVWPKNNNSFELVGQRILANSLKEPGMHEGMNDYIYYKTWNGSLWRAKLQKVRVSKINGIVFNASDPDFGHYGSDFHTEEFIDYLSDIGEKRRTKCHSHSDFSSEVWFSFEHFREGRDDDKHEDGIINIIDWDGKKWTISIPNGWANEKDEVSTQFMCKRKI